LKAKADISTLYKQLRKLVDEQYAITLTDEDSRGYAKIVISPTKKSFPWTAFEGHSLEEALVRAMRKLEYPDEDYVAINGHIWKATEESIFSAEHIRLFVRKVNQK